MSVPEGLDPSITTREITFEADVTSVTPFLKLATVSREGTGHLSFACDEGPNLGASAPLRRRQVPCEGLGAERHGCFVMQALLNPVPVTARTVLNGRPIVQEGLA
jgi:hypothetical protein